MGVMKKVLKYTVPMAIAGLAGYELARMSGKSGSRRGSMPSMSGMGGSESREYESREYSPRTEEPSDPRDYRSIYHL